MTSRNIGTATVGIKGDTSQLGKDIEQGVSKASANASSAIGGMNEKMKAVGAAAKLYLADQVVQAIGKIGEFAGESIDAFSDLNESINAVGVTFGPAADDIRQLGEEAARSLGLSNAEFNTLAVSTAAFTEQIAQGLGTDVASVVDEMTTRISDFASVMNLDVAEAAEKFRSGLAGESEPLRQFGIDVSAATVEQVALAEGIIQTGETMTETQKIQARYLTIMEQTEKTAGDFANTADELANKERIAAAELENMKARAGEALAPFRELRIEFELVAAQTLGVMAIGFQNLTGAITDAQADIQQFEVLTGGTAETLEGLVTINQTYGTSFADLGAEMELSLEETQKLTDGQRVFLDSIGLTTEEIEELDRVLAEEHAQAAENLVLGLQEARTDTDAMAASTENLTDEVGINTAAIQANIEALETQQDRIRAQTDPLFALFSATQDQAEAQQTLNDLIADGVTSGPEYEQALVDVGIAALDVKDAQGQARVATDLTKQAFIDQQVAAGNARDKAQELADVLFGLSGLKLDPIQLAVEIRELRRSAGSQRGGVLEGTGQHGGTTQGGAWLVGEAGPEIVLPPAGSRIIPNGESQRMMGSTFSPTVNISLNGGATRRDAVMVAAEVETALRQLAREQVAG